ncbi:MAG: hypothetical protein QOF64_2872, partial [Candidatus Binatota bacterium]|nr:hypothetical protein [Candidatus Binatota bacterium]
ETLHKNYIVDALPMVEVIQAEMKNLTATVPELRGKRAADFVAKSILTELDREGFFARLSAK